MNEFGWNNRVDFTMPITDNIKNKIKVGANSLVRASDFNENRFNYSGTRSPLDPLNGDFSNFVRDENLGVIEGLPSVYMTDATEAQNSYTGTESIQAAYAMVDYALTPRLRALTGLRYERTDIEAQSDDPDKEVGTLKNNDFLPALNLTYSLTDKMNVRAAYGRTIARPVFRRIGTLHYFLV